jgi:hypothetical protein
MQLKGKGLLELGHSISEGFSLAISLPAEEPVCCHYNLLLFGKSILVVPERRFFPGPKNGILGS